MAVAAPDTALPRSATGPNVARALKDAVFTALISFALLLPLVGFKTVQNMRNELELETRLPLLLAIVAVIPAARLFGSLVIEPWRERRVLHPPAESARITTLKAAFVNQFANAALSVVMRALSAGGCKTRRSRHGSITSEPNSLAAGMTATIASSRGRRVSSSSSLRMFCTVLKPTSGSSSAKEISAVNTASFSARATFGPVAERGRAVSGAATAMSHLLHFRPAEQALRQEDQRDGEDRERGDVLVVDREIRRPHGFDQSDEEAADHRAGERADAAEYGRGERLDAGDETVGEIHHAVGHQVHRGGDGRERGADHDGDRAGPVDIDADERCHLLVLLAGALRAAERGLRHQVPEGREQHGGNRPDDELAVRDGDVVAVALHDHDHVLQQWRHRLG